MTLPIITSGWLPAALGGEAEVLRWRTAAGHDAEIHRPTLTPGRLDAIALGLREQGERRLGARPVASIIESLDRVAALWLDPTTPERRQAVEQIAWASGFSRQMVAHAIDLEFESSRGPHLRRALESELGDPATLDDFVADTRLGGRVRGFGPGLVGGIASANIPGLPHLIVTRALLVKSPCLIRSSRDEPIFLPLFARTLARVDADLAACLAVVDFDPHDAALEAAFLGRVDHLVAFGGVETLAGLRARLPPRVAATWHGHRLGFGVVARDALGGDVADLADRVAYDFSLFDGEACLSPQVVFVEEGGEVTPRELARAIAAAMGTWCERLPPCRFPLTDRARFRAALDLLAMRSAAGEPVGVIADEAGYAVVLDLPARLAPAPRGRFVRVVPIPDVDAVPGLVAPLGPQLQVAFLEGGDERSARLHHDLARLGVTRITRAGLAGLPSMMWRHDGIACLGALVRWVTEERTAPRDRA